MEFTIDSYLKNRGDSFCYLPVFFRLNKHTDVVSFQNLITSNTHLIVIDEIEGQLVELIKSLSPHKKFSEQDYHLSIEEHLNGIARNEYGVWVYYPWNNQIVHLLDEEEFVKLRTNRNQYKITPEEQDILRKKKIGIIGLSVGQSIALTLAMERTCGELRLADYDTAELSNLNRIRTGVQNLGLLKTIIAAREIAEIDPFLKVKIYNEGITEKNIDSFFEEDGKLDLLVEVCDGLDVKIKSRFKARSLNIPVVMDTNDKGMLDVERFDIEPTRAILHGLAEGLDANSISDLTNEQKIPYILKMVGSETISTRLKASMMEIEQTISSWPQLASSVVLGGAVTTDVCRRILLNQFQDSGRFYVNFDEIIKNKNSIKKKLEIPDEYIAPLPLDDNYYTQLAEDTTQFTSSVELSKEATLELLKAAIQAPSGGNCQPWKFVVRNNTISVFHDRSLSHSFLDFNHLGSYIGLGASIENIYLKSEDLGLQAIVHNQIGDNQSNNLVAIISFKKLEATTIDDRLIQGIFLRHTNRNLGPKFKYNSSHYQSIKEIMNNYLGSEIDFVVDDSEMKELGDILATAEKLVLMHPRGHYDAFHRELRWNEEETESTMDGLDVSTLGLTEGEVAAMRIAHDRRAMEFLRETIKGGDALKKMSTKAVACSSALAVISMPSYSAQMFLDGGRAVERFWIAACMEGIAVQPIAQFVFVLTRLLYGSGNEMNDEYKKEFSLLKNRFYKLLPTMNDRQPVFIFRLSKAEEPEVKSLRKPIDSVSIFC